MLWEPKKDGFFSRLQLHLAPTRAAAKMCHVLPSTDGDTLHMDRNQLELRLAEAERNVSLGHQLIAEQHIILAELESWGQDAAAARQLLRAFEEMQALHLDDLETAVVQLAAHDARNLPIAS